MSRATHAVSLAACALLGCGTAAPPSPPATTSTTTTTTTTMPPAEHRFVVPPKNVSGGSRPAVDLWDSHTSQADCIKSQVGAIQSQIKLLQAGVESRRAETLAGTGREAAACKEGTIATLTHATGVELIAGSAPECGKEMLKVRVVSGKHQGMVGCIETVRLAPARPQ